ncbi:MAG: ATP phosphoribosyltransferase regulatory subunit [Dehalococcoidia bacterium]|nr:ATP phosphoribosyltransferase regulatory subunit [Dehalococcoidia bacterium]
MRDLLPEDMSRFRRIEDVFRESCTSFGYQEVRTPTMEYLHSFTSTGTLTPQMLRSVYSFLDWDGWSGERVVLRPDGTIPLARLFVDELPGNTRVNKFFYVENIFRFTESAEEARERWQCGAELLGSALPQADAELVVLALEVLDHLCLSPAKVEVSHAGILKHLLEQLDLDPEEQGRVFDEIQEGDLQSLALAEREHPRMGRFLPLLLEPKGQGSGFLKNLKATLVADFPGLGADFDSLIQLADLLTGLGRPYEINFALPGGFEYYTGFMFQVFLDSEKVVGGGRYDELIPLVGGPSIPSAGFALYLDRLMAFLASRAGQAPSTPKKVLLMAQGPAPEDTKRCFELASRLHKEGVVAEVDLGQDREGYSHIIAICGEDRRPSYKVEEVSTGKAVSVPAQDLQRLLTILGSAT